MYRIIGITPDGRIKVIKNTAIVDDNNTATIKWHNTRTANVNWNETDLYKRLNGITSSYSKLFMGSNKYSYMNNSSWTSKIVAVDWPYLDMYESYYGTNGTANSVYNKEMSTDNAKVTDEIGLMYIHDYMYSGKSGGRNCYKSDSDYATCKNSWLHISNNGKSSDSNAEWTIAKNGQMGTENSYVTWGIQTNGGVNDNNYLDDALMVRPVFYLSSDVSITGSGTSTDPFVVH